MSMWYLTQTCHIKQEFPQASVIGKSQRMKSYLMEVDVDSFISAWATRDGT